MRDEAGLDHVLATPPGLLPLGTWTHVALAYDQATGRARLHVNGREVAAEDLSTFAPWTGLNLNFGLAPVGSRRFTGRLDELAVYGRALEAGEIEAVFLAGGRGKCRPRNETPSVSAGDDQEVYVPQKTASLSGTVTDDGRPRGRLVTSRWSLVSGPPGGTAVFIEVKSSTKVKDVHLDDLALQCHVLAGAGLNIVSCHLMRFNTAYTYAGGEVDLTELFAMEELSSIVLERQVTVPDRIAAMKTMLLSPVAPVVDPDGHCFTPYECPFWAHCTSQKPARVDFSLARGQADRQSTGRAGCGDHR